MLMLLTALNIGVLLVVTLIPVAIWQQTRITGFLLLAVSFGFGALSEGLVSMLFARLAPESIETAVAGLRVLSLLMSALAAVGLWQIYRSLRRPRAAPPAPAGGGT